MFEVLVPRFCRVDGHVYMCGLPADGVPSGIGRCHNACLPYELERTVVRICQALRPHQIAKDVYVGHRLPPSLNLSCD